MARLNNIREQRVQYFYDTDFITAGAQSASTDNRDIARSSKQLFAAAQPGAKERTNMPAPGFLTSDQTFLTYAVRHEMLFHGGNYPGGAAGFQDTRAVALLTLTLSSFEFQVSEKVAFEGPITMTPAGGGPWGFNFDSAQPIIVNGEPQSKAIYVLPLPVPVVARQGIRVNELKATIAGTTSIDLPTYINGYTGAKLLRCYLDGFNTRDVQ